MRVKKRLSKSSLFLLELISSVLIFTACAIVCIYIFISGSTLSNQASNNEHALMHVVNLKECYQTVNTLDDLQALYKDAIIDEHSFTLTNILNEDTNKTGTLTLVEKTSNNLIQAHIEYVLEDGTILYSLDSIKEVDHE